MPIVTATPAPTQDQTARHVPQPPPVVPNVPPAQYKFKPIGPARHLPEITFDGLLVKQRVEGYSREHDKCVPQGAITLRLCGSLMLHPDHLYFLKRGANPYEDAPDFNSLNAQVPVQSDAGYVEWLFISQEELELNSTLPECVHEICLNAAPAGWLEAQREAYERSL